MNINKCFICFFFWVSYLFAMEQEEINFTFLSAKKKESLSVCRLLAQKKCEKIYQKEEAPRVTTFVNKQFKKAKRQLKSNPHYRFIKIFNNKTLVGYVGFYLNTPQENECDIEILNVKTEYNPHLSQKIINYLKETYQPKRIYTIARKHKKNASFVEKLGFIPCEHKRDGYEEKQWQGYMQNVGI